MATALDYRLVNVHRPEAMTDPRTMGTRPAEWPTTIACEGTPDHPHELVTWLGVWTDYDDSTCDPPCWACGALGHSTAPRYPHVRYGSMCGKPVPPSAPYEVPS